MNLRTKFHLASSCLILTVVIGMMASLLLFEKKRLRMDIERQQMDELDKLAHVGEDTMIVFDEPALFKYAKNLVALSSPKIVYAGFVYPKGAEGSPWVWEQASDRLAYVDLNDPNILAIQDSGKTLVRDIVINGKRVTELSKPVSRIGHVRLGYSRDVVESALRETIQKSVKRFVVVGLIAIVLG